MTTASDKPKRSERVIAVDWSGRLIGEGNAIWLAEVEHGAVTRLDCGRSRIQVIDELCRIAVTASVASPVLVGLDFSFSFPAWFVRHHRCHDIGQLWELAADDGERWLTQCEPPFWGRPGKPRPPDLEQFRVCEYALPAVNGVRPKSTFQIGGAGSVGTGSVRGMALLPRLREHGCSIWPFDPPGPVTVFEMYPRLFTGPVVKSDANRRREYLDSHFADIGTDVRASGVRSEDAFDALVCALTIANMHRPEDLMAAPALPSGSTAADLALEGWIPQA